MNTEAKQIAGQGQCPHQSHWNCPNFLPEEGDTSMEYEHYECKVCGKRDKLDYEEMR